MAVNLRSTPADRSGMEGDAAVRRRNYRRLCAFTAPFAAMWVVIVIGGAGGPGVAKSVSNGTLAATALGAGVSCGYTAVRSRGRYRTVWALLALGMVSWGVGQVIWDYYEVIAREDVPFPSMADAGYLLEVPLVAAALIRLPSGTRSVAGRARTLLDGLIVAAALLLMSWMLVLGKIFHEGSGTFFSQVLSLAYPIGDVVTVTIVVYAILRARQTGRTVPPPLLLVGIGLVCLAIADSGFTYQTAVGTYVSGAPIDTGWFGGFLLVFLAARSPQALHAEQEGLGDVQRS